MSTTHATRRSDTDGPVRRTWRNFTVPGRFLERATLEVAIMTAGFVLYNAGRRAVQGQEAVARGNAEFIRHLEAAIHLPSEAALQATFEAAPNLFELANRYYVSMHFPVMIAFLLWGFLARPRDQYVWARNLLVSITFLGLAIHLAFPLAPPRMFPQWGFIDTMTTLGPSPYDGASAAVANQYAAMPSLHIGWALLVALVLVRTGPRPLALLGVLHAATTVFVVVVTANHWWLDGAVAAALLASASVAFPGPGVTRLARASRPPPSDPAPNPGGNLMSATTPAWISSGPDLPPNLTPGATTHVHHASSSAWLVLSGSLTPPGGLKSLVREVRRAHARLPRDVDAIGIDLSQLRHITIDLAVLLCLENRIHCLRGRTLVAVVRGEGTASPGAERVLDTLPIVRANDERSAGLARSLTNARYGELGSETLGLPRPGSFATPAG